MKREYLLLIIVTCISGCLQTRVPQWSTPGLIESAGNRELADRLRLQVFEELKQRELDPNQYQRLGEVFSTVVGSPLHSPLIRQDVIQIISTDYRNQASEWLGRALLNSSESEIRSGIIEALIKLQDRKSVPYLIITLDRAEKNDYADALAMGEALETLTSEPLERILWKELNEGDRIKSRMAALDCLQRRMKPDSLCAQLKVLPGSDPFLQELQFWADRFAYIPSNQMRFFLCQLLHNSLTAEQINLLQRRVSQLAEREGYRFDIRDTYVLLSIDNRVLDKSCEELKSKIAPRLSRLDHTKRPASYGGARDDYKETFIDQCNRLSYIDLLKIDLLLCSLDKAVISRQIKEFLKQDLTDIATEIGGLCFIIASDSIIFKKYQPGEVLGDNQYVESEHMLLEGALCLARWHCHIDSWLSKELAGPGSDDLRYAAWVNCPVVIFTCLGEDLFNADYLTPEGVVIDLGNY